MVDVGTQGPDGWHLSAASGRAEPGSHPPVAPALTLSCPWPINGALSLISLFPLTWEEVGEILGREA